MKRIKTWKIFEDKNYHSKIGIKIGTNGRSSYNFNEEGLKSLQKTNLEIPKYVDGNFYCAENELTDLKGAPESVGLLFDCSRNLLTTLEGGPKTADGFICTWNKLTDLKGAPEIVGGWFDCSHNENLTSFEGAPKQLAGFACDYLQFNRSNWNPKGWLFKLGINEIIDSRIKGLLTVENCAPYFKENPTEIYLLDSMPELKAEILKSIGMRDINRLNRNLKSRLL